MDEESKKLVREIMNAFPSLSVYLAFPLIPLGLIFTLAYGNKGLPLFALGLVYLLLPILPRGKMNKTILHPTLLAGAAAVFIASIAYYIAVGPTPGDLESSGYYSLIGLSLALFLAGIADFSLYTSRISIENRISTMDLRLQDEAKHHGEIEAATERRLNDLERRQAEDRQRYEERTNAIIEHIGKELERIREDDAEQWGGDE
jgi:hypothetical protein